MDPGISLFNPVGESLHFDIPNRIDPGKEEDEEAEEIKIKERELQDLLSTEFDDLIDEDEASSIASEEFHHLPQRPLNPAAKLLQKWPLGKENETSTPKHYIPPWTLEYTPINQQPSNNLPNNSVMNGISNRHLTNGHSTGYQNEQQSQQPLNGFKENFNQAGDQNFMPQNGDSFIQDDHYGEKSENNIHHQYAQELVRLKETIVHLQEESSQNTRLLKHQLILAKGEKESLAFSLQQARQVLNDKEQEQIDTQKKMTDLENQLEKATLSNQDLLHKLEMSQSSVVSLQEQLTEMTKFETHTFVKDKQDQIIQNMKLRHQQEMDAYKRNLDAKEVEVDRLLKQMETLERYQEQTLPHKLKNIDQLTRNLESVDDYCQQLLSTGAFQDVNKLRTESNDANSAQNIQILLKAINDLGGTLRLNINGESQHVPIDTHRTLINQLEKEKENIMKQFEALKSESKDTNSEIYRLSEENQKLRATMETMIRKHDLDIKSAIEKYHSLHSRETKLLQNELNDASEEEKDRLRSFYEEKLTTLYMEIDSLKSSVDEIKTLYVRVCEEKNNLETEIQSLQTPPKPKQLEFAWKQTQTENNFEIKDEKTQKQLVESREEISLLREQLRNVRVKYQNERDSESKEMVRLLDEKTEKLELKEKELREFREYFTQSQQHLQSVYNEKLEVISRGQKMHLDGIMVDVQKIVEQEKAEYLVFINQLKERIRELETELGNVREASLNKKDVSINTILPTLKEQYLTEQLQSNHAKLNEIQERNKNLRNTSSQTEEELISKKLVLEMKSLYKEIIRQIADEVEMYMTNSCTVTAEYVKSAILQYLAESAKTMS